VKINHPNQITIKKGYEVISKLEEKLLVLNQVMVFKIEVQLKLKVNVLLTF
jgi:hypothetical protein